MEHRACSSSRLKTRCYHEVWWNEETGLGFRGWGHGLGLRASAGVSTRHRYGCWLMERGACSKSKLDATGCQTWWWNQEAVS